ncbi:hypothetical protein AB0F81_34170, partial [Actinoplanes sp. NPDC024001]|uniref:hypothetical protein n=1 Tax=Actinoplanes sp. NPDC024001 TaxID=3154598 RepID=UPI0033CA17DA
IIGVGLSGTLWLTLFCLAFAGAADMISGIFRTAPLLRAWLPARMAVRRVVAARLWARTPALASRFVGRVGVARFRGWVPVRRRARTVVRRAAVVAVRSSARTVPISMLTARFVVRVGMARSQAWTVARRAVVVAVRLSARMTLIMVLTAWLVGRVGTARSAWAPARWRAPTVARRVAVAALDAPSWTPMARALTDRREDAAEPAAPWWALTAGWVQLLVGAPWWALTAGWVQLLAVAPWWALTAGWVQLLAVAPWWAPTAGWAQPPVAAPRWALRAGRARPRAAAPR